ncbi:MAG TPA: AzlD domain-containing protein [Actinomycetota bacterium]|nr:AzlD domain-containing protein [Actinomycetota bacterium]
MSSPWAAVLVVGAATIALKAAGPVALGGRPLPPRLAGVIELLAPAVLAALVVTQVADGGGRALGLDERAIGVAVAAAALALRAPTLLAVVAAAASTALARALL